MAPAGNRKPRMAVGKRNPRSHNHTFLPEDLIFEIMVRLPVRSLLRFKTLSKFYYNLIGSSKHFIQNHCEHRSSDHHPSLLVHHADKILNHEDHSDFTDIVDETLDNLDEYPSDFPFCMWKVIGCPVNGLVLLQGGRIINYIHPGMNHATIFNPATRQFKEIKAPIRNSRIDFGFGYDPTTDDFKVIAFPHPKHAGGLFFHAYSLANDSWTQILDHGISAHDESKLHQTFGSTYFNGTFHWLFSNTYVYNDGARFSILSFNMSNQTFDVFDGPENPTGKRPYLFSREYHNNKSNDYLLSTLFYWPRPNHDVGVADRSIDLMVMKNKGRWEKHLSIDIGVIDQRMYILGLWKDKRLLFKTGTNEVRIYDTDTNEIQELGRIDKIARILQIFSYKGSLVSVKGGTYDCTSEKPHFKGDDGSRRDDNNNNNNEHVDHLN